MCEEHSRVFLAQIFDSLVREYSQGCSDGRRYRDHFKHITARADAKHRAAQKKAAWKAMVASRAHAQVPDAEGPVPVRVFSLRKYLRKAD